MIPEPARRVWFVPVSLIAILALILRFIAISRYGFDGDEVFNLHAADSTWAHLLSTAANDKSHLPSFMQLSNYGLILAPTDEGWVRLLSVFFGVALVPITAAICRQLRLSHADTALVLILIAINGSLISYSQYTRNFALLDLCAGVSILFFIRLTINPFSWHNLGLLTAANLVDKI